MVLPDIAVTAVMYSTIKVLPDITVAIRSCLMLNINLLFVGMCVRVHDNCERQPPCQGVPLTSKGGKRSCVMKYSTTCHLLDSIKPEVSRVQQCGCASLNEEA